MGKESVKKAKAILIMLILGVILVNVKRIFMDFETDCEYAVAMSYRMTRGDAMITQMWEPHQTSAFLNALLIRLYLLFTGTTTGIVLYLNLMGCVARCAVAWVFYRTFRKCCSRKILLFCCIFFLTVNAKSSLLLEFSNMLVYFSVLLCCSLYQYLKPGDGVKLKLGDGEKQEKRWLVLSAVLLCLTVISYPAALILYPVLIYLICRHSEEKKKDVALITGICGMAGGAYMLCLIASAGWGDFWFCVRQIVTGDGSHEAGLAEKLLNYILESGKAAVLLLGCGGLAFVLVYLWRFFRRKEINTINGILVVSFALLFALNLVRMIFGIDPWIHLVVYFPILFLGCRWKKYCSEEEQLFFQIGMMLSLGSGLAVLILTNLTVLTTASYLILGVMVSMVPIGRYLQQCAQGRRHPERVWGIMVLFLCVTIFQNLVDVRSVSDIGAYSRIIDVRGVVKSGPEAGIFMDYIGAYKRNRDLEEWKENVYPGDRILIVDTRGGGTSNIGYLYEDTEVCIDSTICTPTYNEKLLQYWEQNPEKEPNVVIMECWFGEMLTPEDHWIRQWVEANFDSYTDGTYVRFYRRSVDE